MKNETNHFAQLNTEAAFGRSDGKILWQPRIGCWYTDKVFAGQPLPAPFTGMDLPAIHRALQVSGRPYGDYNPCFVRVEHPSVNFTREPINNTDTRITVNTPAGRQVSVTRRTESSNHVINVKWPVETEEELKVAAWREENTDWKWDEARYQKAQTEVGDLAAPTMFMPRMNVQSLYIEKMGVEKGVYALYDWPDTAEAYFRALEESHSRLIRVINASPIELINFGENVHSGTLPPDLFLKYHLPACRRRCDLLHQAGKFVFAHWDGNVKPLLPYARETGLDGIEAITPLPQGDVTLEEIKAGLGDDLFLIDGVPAVYFDDTYPVETLRQCVRDLVRLFAPKLILGISDEISSTGDLNRVCVVRDMIDKYNRTGKMP